MFLFEISIELDSNDCVFTNLNAMTEGRCVLTYNWGDQLKQYLGNDEFLKGKFGVAPTPGSQRVLNRDTGELISCDKATCPHGKFYDDIGWVNHAPYLAFGRRIVFADFLTLYEFP